MQLALFSLMSFPDRGASLRKIVSDTVDMVRLAEDLDFNTAWFAEHHFCNYSMCPSPLMMAAHCAAVTDRIRLGPAVLVLPLYHPVRMVEEICLLDVQSNGRAVIGIGSGYQPFEFERFAVDIDQKLPIFHEIWDIMELALQNEEFTYNGEYFKLPNTPMCLRPVQKPMPEVFVAGVNPSLVERVAKSGYVPIVSPGFRGFDKLLDLKRRVEEGYKAAGKSSQNVPLGVQRYIHVADTRKEAIHAAECARFIGRTVANMVAGNPQLDGFIIKPLPFEGEPTLDDIIENLHIGDPETIAQGIIRDIRTVHPVHYNCFFAFGPLETKKAIRSLERFGTEVMPLIEKELGPLSQLKYAA